MGVLPSVDSMLDVTIKVVGSAVVVGVLVFLAYVFYKQKKYNIYVMVRSLRSDGYKILEDMGCIRMLAGIETLHLKKMNTYLPLPNYSVFETGVKGKTFLALYQTGNKELYYCKPVVNLKGKRLELDPVERDVIAWYLNSKELVEQTLGYKDLFEKYMPIIGVGILLIGAIIIIALLLKEISPIADAMNSAAKAMNTAANALMSQQTSGLENAAW